MTVPDNITPPVRYFYFEFEYEEESADSFLWFDEFYAITNKAGLAAKINEARTIHDEAVEGTEIGQFDPGSKAIFMQEIEEAEEILNDGTVKQNTVNGAVKDLDNAIEAFMQSKVTEDAWAAMEAAIEAAQEVYDTAQVGTEPGYYTQEAKDALQSAINTARDKLEDESITRLQMVAAIAALNNAVVQFQASVLKVEAPAKPKATGYPDHILLEWQEGAFAESYNILRSTTIGGPYETIASGIEELEYTDGDIEEHQIYYYKIVSVYNETEVPSYEINSRSYGDYQLQPLNLFRTYVPGGWVSNAEFSGSYFPVDRDNTYNGLPSLRINVTNGNWWGSGLSSENWQTYSIYDYYENGALEFYVKGNSGGEGFLLGFEDANGSSIKYVSVSSYVDITTEWKHVYIPLKELINKDAFNMNAILTLRIDKDYSAPAQIKVWINDIKVTSPDIEKSYAAIKVNQVGYTPYAEKYALVSAFPDYLPVDDGDSFAVKDAATGEVKYTGKLKLVTELDAKVSGEKVLKADFSGFQTPGTYYISIDGLEDSYRFSIGKDIYKDFLVDVTRYYYMQRANMDLEEQYAGIFARQGMHMDDANAPLLSDMDGPRRDVSKGWYDAGDFGKYVNAGSSAVSDLLWTYEIFTEQFYDGQANIPESGNGIPDILDEALYELEWILKMQDSDGGFYSRVFPQNDLTAQRYIDNRVGTQLSNTLKPTNHTAGAVGVLAHASMIYRPIDEAFADECLESAKAGWTYLAAHPNHIPGPEGPYYTTEDKGMRFYAAAALYRATGEEQYHQYVLDHYKDFSSKFDNPENGYNCTDLAHIGYFHYLSSEAVDSGLVQWYRAKYAIWFNKQVERSRNGVWHNNLEDDDYYWGSNMPILTSTLVMAIGSKILGYYGRDVVDVARRSLNYILGVNPMAYSYVSGYGENCHKNVYSGIYSNDGLDEVPKGYMAGGANMYQGAFFSRFAGKCYIDSNKEWTTNEHTIYWNSPLVFTAALVNAEALNYKPVPESGPSPSPSPKLSEGTTGEPVGTPGTLELEAAAPVDGNVFISIPEDAVIEALEKTGTEDGWKELLIKVPVVEAANSYTLSIPSGILTSSQADAVLNVETAFGTIILPTNMFGNRAVEAGASIELTIEAVSPEELPGDTAELIGDRPVIKLITRINGEAAGWNNQEAPVTVELPYTPSEEEKEKAEHLLVYHIDDAGNATVVPGSRYNPEAGKITFTITHFSYYAVAFVEKTFNDLATHEWARKHIEVLASRGIIKGVSATEYRPGAAVRQGDFITLLARTLQLDAETADGLKVLADNTSLLKREEAMRIAAKALASKGVLTIPEGMVQLDFSDAGEIAEEAKASIAALIEAGIIVGTPSSTLLPGKQMTRAEAAVIIYRINSMI